MPQEKINFIYQPKWRGRKIVRHFVSAVAIGAITLSLSYVYAKTEQGWTRDSVITKTGTKGPRDQFINAITVFVTSGTTWTVPADCTNVDRVDCIGAGGSGGACSTLSRVASGGGGGGWSRQLNVPVTPNSSIALQIGVGGAGVSSNSASTPQVAGNLGGDTWFNGASLAVASCGAKGGGGGAAGAQFSGLSGGAGGAAASGVGASKTSGGAGGATAAGSATNGAAGGGGAGGPSGNGVAGTTYSTNATATAGGAGDAGLGGAGSAGQSAAAGGAGTEYDASHGSGGGSGGRSSTGGSPGSGGLYGGGSGGVYNSIGSPTTTSSGPGANGLIVIVYTPSPPTVTGVSPNQGPISGGTVVALTGTFFTGATSVSFGGTNGTGLTVNSAISITVTAPAHAAGLVDVTVTTPNGTSAISAADRFTFIAAPTVTAVSPNVGPASGGTVVTVTGTAFTTATSVAFGATNGTGLSITNDNTLLITSPAHASGTVDVRVTNPTGQSAINTPADQFTFESPLAGLVPESPYTVRSFYRVIAYGPIEGGSSGFTST